MGTAHIQLLATRCRRWCATAAEPGAAPGRPPLVSRRAGSACSPAAHQARPGHPAALGTACSRTRGIPGQKMKTEISCRAYGSGRASRRSRNTMRVRPYAIRFPSRNARHTALSAPGGCMSTSGCSCRYRSSLRTCSGGPSRTSCTGQYRYPVSGQRNGFPKSPATRHRRRSHERIPPSWTLPVPMTNPGTTFASAAAARQHPYTTGPLTTAERRSGCPGRRLEAGQPTLGHVFRDGV